MARRKGAIGHDRNNDASWATMASQVAEIIHGEMAEWPKAPDSKSGLPKGNVGSTPTLSSRMGTLKGFPCPPAMVRGEQSSPAPHAKNKISGEMAEWPKAPDSKSGLPQGNVGSTPTLSSTIVGTLKGFPHLPRSGSAGRSPAPPTRSWEPQHSSNADWEPPPVKGNAAFLQRDLRNRSLHPPHAKERACNHTAFRS